MDRFQSFPLPLNRLKCFSCSSFKQITEFPLGRDRFRGSTCQKCLSRRVKKYVKEIPILYSSEFSKDLEEDISLFQFCSGCNQKRSLIEFALKPGLQRHLICKICQVRYIILIFQNLSIFLIFIF